MNTQIELKDNEIPAWAFYENGEGLLSLIFFAKSSPHARPNAALLNIYPWDALPAIDDSDIARLWKAVNERVLGDWCTYDVKEINQYLEQRFCQLVAKASHAQLFPLPIE
jgi:hypothetical protein